MIASGSVGECTFWGYFGQITRKGMLISNASTITNLTHDPKTILIGSMKVPFLRLVISIKYPKRNYCAAYGYASSKLREQQAGLSKRHSSCPNSYVGFGV